MVKFGSARISENGTVDGRKGDQTHNECMIQDGYIHRNGWRVLRPKKVEDANAIAFLMKCACQSDVVGYSQPDRLAIWWQGLHENLPTNADCSSLVAWIVNQLNGVNVNAFSTHTEVQELLATGRFAEVKFVSLDELYTGDILVDGKCTSHTVVVTDGISRDWAWFTLPQPTLKRGDKGEQVRRLQIYLNEYCNDNLKTDGDFGLKTENSVCKFQGFWGLEIDGEYGSHTFDACAFGMFCTMYC